MILKGCTIPNFKLNGIIFNYMWLLLISILDITLQMIFLMMMMMISIDNVEHYLFKNKNKNKNKNFIDPKQKYISSKVQPFRENQKQIKSIIVHVT